MSRSIQSATDVAVSFDTTGRSPVGGPDTRAAPDADVRLRAIFEQTAVGFAEADLNGAFVLANARYAEIVGRSVGEIVAGLTMQEISHPDDVGRHVALFGRCIRTGEPFEIEMRYVRPDGSDVWVRNSVSRIDDAGGPTCVLAVCEDITDRVRAEQALRESERRYRGMFDTSAVSIWEEDFSAVRAFLDDLRGAGVTDLAGHLDANPEVLRHLVQLVRVVDVNEATLALFAAHDKDELRRSLETIFVDATLPAFRDEVLAIWAGGGAMTAHAQLQAVDGSRRDVLFAVRFPEGDAGYDSVPVALIDVTSQLRAKAEAQRVRADLHQLLVQAPVPIAVVGGPDLVFELANPAYVAVAGGRELVGRRVLDALPELRGQGYDAMLRTVMETGEPARAEDSLLRLERDGVLQDTWWTFIYAPLRNDAGLCDRVMAICNEVTPQVQARRAHERLLVAEQAARTEAEAASGRFLDLVQGLDAVVWEADAATFDNTFVSQRIETILGYPAERWVEPGFWAARLHPDDRERVLGSFRACVGDRCDDEIEYRMVAADGRTVWMRDLVHVVPEAGGRPRLLRGVMVDVTERKIVERAREAFIGVLSHELRTPVTTIIGAAQLLARDDGSRPAEVQRELVHDVAAEAQRLGRLVEDLLVLSRRERDQLVFEPEPVLVQHAVRATVKAESERSPGVRFETEVESLPPVAADRTYVEQILRNLLSNAVKYGPPSGATVRVVARQEDGRVVVRVLDEGAGFPATERDRLFDLFYRATTAQRRSGAGIGLYVIRALVEAMGGKVWADARPTGGSEFGFWLPVMPDAD